jgi:hypothetical protein
MVEVSGRTGEGPPSEDVTDIADNEDKLKEKYREVVGFASNILQAKWADAY